MTPKPTSIEDLLRWAYRDQPWRIVRAIRRSALVCIAYVFAWFWIGVGVQVWVMWP